MSRPAGDAAGSVGGGSVGGGSVGGGSVGGGSVGGGSVGIVATHSVRLFNAERPLSLASGERLVEVDVAYETYGELSPARDNVVLVCHALTGDAHAAGYHEGSDRPGWWDNLIGPGKPLDTDRVFVVCANLIGGCQGSTGPTSINPATDEPYGLDFPLLQMSDFVTVQRELLRRLGIDSLLALVGGSLGGMQVLQWALSFPEQVANAIVIAASSRLSAQNIAFSAVGRESIMRDEEFDSGRYVAAGASPATGLAVARMLAHITYLSEEAMTAKFGRRFQDSAGSKRGFGIDFAVESYLNYQGNSFLTRFDALSYLYLTRVMDYFDPFAPDRVGTDDRHPAAGAVARQLRFVVVSFDSDWRFSTAHSRRIVRELESAGAAVSFREIASPWGHDSFLMQIPDYHATVAAVIDRALEEQASSIGLRGAGA